MDWWGGLPGTGSPDGSSVKSLQHLASCLVEMLTILFCISFLKHWISFDLWKPITEEDDPDPCQGQGQGQQQTQDISDDDSSVYSSDEDSHSCRSELTDSSDLEEDLEEEEEADYCSSLGNYSFTSNQVEASTCYNDEDDDESEEELGQEFKRKASLKMGGSVELPDFPNPLSADAVTLNGELFIRNGLNGIDPGDHGVGSEAGSLDSQHSWLQEHYGHVFNKEFKKKKIQLLNRENDQRHFR